MRRHTRQQLLVAAAVVVAGGIGAAVVPHIQTRPATGGGMTLISSAASPSTAAPAAADALQDLRALPVSDAHVGGYERGAFGQAWADTDHNGCDTRNDVLRRDLTAVVTKPGTHGCVVLSGTLHDPYTGRTVVFHRGSASSLAVQIDHRYPLALAWRHGASTWTADQRELFANDQATNLVAVDGQANEDKSDSGPGEWMPPNTGDACDYATLFVTVATKWRLSIGSADEDALERTLTGCTTQGSN